MAVEISVGPPVLTINQGSTFMVTDPNGEIAADSEQGVFAADTRFVSYYAISANGQAWTLLTSAATSYYAARVYLVNQSFPTEDGDVPAGVLGLTISRAVGEGVHEDLDLVDHSLERVRFNLEVALRSDFADLFEVKWRQFVRPRPGYARRLALEPRGALGFWCEADAGGLQEVGPPTATGDLRGAGEERR